MALSMDVNRKEREGNLLVLPVAGSEKIYGGAMVAINADGYAVAGKTAVGLTAIGCADERAINISEVAGAIDVKVKLGTFAFNNSSGDDEISRKNIGDFCYIVDDDTVALTDGSTTVDTAKKRSLAGKIFDVDDDGVWVAI